MFEVGETIPGHGKVIKVSQPTGRSVLVVGKFTLPFCILTNVPYSTIRVYGSYFTIEEALKVFHDDIIGGCDKCMVEGDIHPQGPGFGPGPSEHL